MEEYASVRNSWGLTLFIRQGLVAWMHAWPREHAIHEDSNIHRFVSGATDLPEQSPSFKTQIALVLADMIFNRSHQETML